MNALLNNPAFVASMVALMGAITAYIQSRVQGARQGAQIQAVKEQVQNKEAQPSGPAVVVAPVAAGGGAKSLLGLDPVNQGAGVSVGPAPNATGAVDCGPACVVSEIANIKRVWSADELLRLRYFGAVDMRLTTADDLVGMLAANDIPAHTRNVDADTCRIEIVRNWQAGRTSIVLGDWITPGFGHWMRFRGDDGRAEFMDPWIGGQRTIGWDEFKAKYDGWYVHVDTAPPAPLIAGGGALQAAA